MRDDGPFRESRYSQALDALRNLQVAAVVWRLRQEGVRGVSRIPQGYTSCAEMLQWARKRHAAAERAMAEKPQRKAEQGPHSSGPASPIGPPGKSSDFLPMLAGFVSRFSPRTVAVICSIVIVVLVGSVLLADMFQP